MKSIFSKIFQGASVAALVYDQYSDLIPGKYKVPIGIGIGVAQAVHGVVAHYYTPDGQIIKPAVVKVD